MAAESSRRMYAFSDAVDLWLRAIRRAEALPDSMDTLDVDPARLRLKAVDALRACGRDTDASALAEETYREYVAHTEAEVAAMIRHRVAYSRRRSSDPEAARTIFAEAARLFDELPESVNQSRLLADYGLCLVNGLWRNAGCGYSPTCARHGRTHRCHERGC